MGYYTLLSYHSPDFISLNLRNQAMQSLIVLPTLLAVALGKAVGPENIVTATSGYAYAVDLAVPVPLSAFNCMKNYGYSTVFVRGYDPAGVGRFDTNAVNNIRNANKAGLGSEVFMKPQPRSVKKGSQQFMEMYDGLRQGAIKVKTVWVQVTSPIEWSPDTKANINFLNDLLSTAKSYGIAIGLYTNVYDWTQITNGASASEGTMLWYWNVNGNGPNGETPANFHDFRPFAKFTNPTVKQFAQVETVCGVTVNRDVYVLNRSTRTLASGPVDSKGELVVGSLGDGLAPELVQIV
ncbi:hypothetical protein RB195_015659 [Necator americanus]|uniref:Glycosyl hydrolase family 25 n=2 Tax=Necator americanus TaxID=51031 RepID=A0ABR1E5J9_NECAM